MWRFCIFREYSNKKSDLCAGIECLPSECNNVSCVVISSSPVCQSTPIEDGSGCSSGVCKMGQCESSSIVTKSSSSKHIDVSYANIE